MRAGFGQQPQCSRPSKTPRPAVAMLAMTRPGRFRINHQSPHPRGDGCRPPSWPLGCLVSPNRRLAAQVIGTFCVCGTGPDIDCQKASEARSEHHIGPLALGNIYDQQEPKRRAAGKKDPSKWRWVMGRWIQMGASQNPHQILPPARPAETGPRTWTTPLQSATKMEGGPVPRPHIAVANSPGHRRRHQCGPEP